MVYSASSQKITLLPQEVWRGGGMVAIFVPTQKECYNLGKDMGVFSKFYAHNTPSPLTENLTFFAKTNLKTAYPVEDL